MAADKRRLEHFRLVPPATLGDDANRAPCRDRRLLALEQLIARGLERDGGACSTMSRLAHEHRSGWRDALQPRRGVDDVARHHPLVRGADRHGGLACEHTRASVDARAECLHCVNQLERRTNGQLGIVLLRDWCSPDGHYRIAYELLDGAAVALDHLAREVEVARQGLPDLFRVTLLGERRETDEIREQDADEAPLSG